MIKPLRPNMIVMGKDKEEISIIDYVIHIIFVLKLCIWDFWHGPEYASLRSLADTKSQANSADRAFVSEQQLDNNNNKSGNSIKITITKLVIKTCL